MERAKASVPPQDGRIYIEKINRPMIDEHKLTQAEYSAGLKSCLDRGWVMRHESGTCVKILKAGEDPFA